MNRNTRFLVVLGVLVAVALLIWTYTTRNQEARLSPVPADSVAAMESPYPDMDADGMEDTEDGRGETASGASICDDLALSDSIGTRPVEERRTKGVAIYEGDPERHRRVDRMVGGDSSYWVWKLPATRAGYWIECSYEGEEVRTRRLPDSVSECTVALQRSATTAVIRGVACS